MPNSYNEQFMRRCLQLAALGAQYAPPNPMVGSVLVHENRIIGEGYHEVYGGAHAEVNCINAVAESDRKLIPYSTLYVSLEPCNHFGKTPPCSKLIIEAGIKKVVIACADSFEKVNGSGIAALRNAAIEVVEHVLEHEALRLNRVFFSFHRQKRPYVILKWAQSADGFIAGEDRKPVRISNDFTNRQVHRWRSETAAILVGTQTVLADDPQLTTRLWEGPNPVRIVIDRHLRIPKQARVFDSAATTIVINSQKETVEKNIHFWRMVEWEYALTAMLTRLYEMNISSLFVEGGATLLQSFVDASLWNEIRVISNLSLNLNSGIKAPVTDALISDNRETLFTDEITYYHAG